MRRVANFLLLAGIIGISYGCVKIPEPIMIEGSKPSGIALRLSLERTTYIPFNLYPNCVLFSRIKNEQFEHPGELKRSNYVTRSKSVSTRESTYIYTYILLLNTPSGKYAPVLSCNNMASVFIVGSHTFFVYWPKEIISSLTYETKPGEIVFLGELQIQFKDDVNDDLSNLDSIQRIYYKEMKENSESIFGKSLLEFWYELIPDKVSYKNDQDAKDEFTEQFHLDFKETEWDSYKLVFLN